MAAIILPSRWTIQPRGRVDIDWSHPLASSLRLFVTTLGGMQVPIDLVSGQFGTANGSAAIEISSIPPGSGKIMKIASASSDYYSWSNVDAHNILAEMTLAWRGVMSSVGAYRHFAGKHASNGATNNPYDFRTNNTAGATPVVLVRSESVASASFSSSGTIAAATTAQTVEMTHTGPLNVNAIAYINGVSSSTSGATGTGATSTTNTTGLRIGRRSDGAVQMDGYTEYLVGWARVLSPGELSLFRNAPYALLKKTPNRSYFFSTPGSDVSVNLTGNSSTFSGGTLTPATSVALSGIAATFSGGSIIPASAVNLTGLAATFAQGTLTPTTGNVVALTGLEATFNAGSIVPATAVSLSGLASTFSYGSFSFGQNPATAKLIFSQRTVDMVFKKRKVRWSLG